MEALLSEGLCLSLGVCNFTPAALSVLLPYCKVERHPLLPQWELLDFCARARIMVQAHSPLGQGRAELLQHEVVLRVASQTGLGTYSTELRSSANAQASLTRHNFLPQPLKSRPL
ncbi:MAG: hypothetical protein SGPRY_013453 [Prymnesium sp.]